MRGERGAVGFEHIIRIAVICGKERLTAYGQYRVDDLLNAFVYYLYSLFSRSHNARMTYHVAVCKVEYHDLVLAALYLFHRSVAYLVSAHFGLHIESGDLRGIDKDPVFAGVSRFYAAVEEEGDVSVFLRFGNSELLYTLL